LPQNNVEVNDYRNVTLIRKAVTNRTAKIKLYLSKESSGQHSILTKNEGRRFIEISAIRLDDYFKNYDGEIDLIKLDIEGAEGLAVRGMSRILETNVKIITEFFPALIRKSGVKPREYLDFLINRGYTLYYINGQENKIDAVTVNEVAQICRGKTKINLLCLK
jgi:FkbM family methyltransferase